MSYYVIKDQNTGEYFRGKGDNAWGKYFNQVSIYRIKGTAEHSAMEINRRRLGNERNAEVVEIEIREKQDCSGR